MPDDAQLLRHDLGEGSKATFSRQPLRQHLGIVYHRRSASWAATPMASPGRGPGRLHPPRPPGPGLRRHPQARQAGLAPRRTSRSPRRSSGRPAAPGPRAGGASHGGESPRPGPSDRLERAPARARPAGHAAGATSTGRRSCCGISKSCFRRDRAPLRLGEAVAQKRVERAPQRLCWLLERSDITSTSAALAALLSSETELPTPGRARRQHHRPRPRLRSWPLRLRTDPTYEHHQTDGRRAGCDGGRRPSSAFPPLASASTNCEGRSTTIGVARRGPAIRGRADRAARDRRPQSEAGIHAAGRQGAAMAPTYRTPRPGPSPPPTRPRSPGAPLKLGWTPKGFSRRSPRPTICCSASGNPPWRGVTGPSSPGGRPDHRPNRGMGEPHVAILRGNLAVSPENGLQSTVTQLPDSELRGIFGDQGCQQFEDYIRMMSANGWRARPRPRPRWRRTCWSPTRGGSRPKDRQ